jgi:hypothetical protein
MELQEPERPRKNWKSGESCEQHKKLLRSTKLREMVIAAAKRDMYILMNGSRRFEKSQSLHLQALTCFTSYELPVTRMAPVNESVIQSVSQFEVRTQATHRKVCHVVHSSRKGDTGYS